MQGLRQAPGSSHMKVSLLGMFKLLSVMSKYNLQSSNRTQNPITLSVCKDNNFYAYNTTKTCFSIHVPSFSLQISSFQPRLVLFPADFIPPTSSCPFPRGFYPRVQINKNSHEKHQNMGKYLPVYKICCTFVPEASRAVVFGWTRQPSLGRQPKGRQPLQ